VAKNCERCGKSFTRNRYGHILGFCSRSCRSKTSSDARIAAGIQLVPWKGWKEYFANGILVHNCRYGIAGTLLDPADVPEHIATAGHGLAAIKDPMRRAVEAYKDYNLKKRSGAEAAQGNYRSVMDERK